MRFLAKFVPGETAIGLFKRFVKDSLVSGCATLCVSLALSSITKTVVPSAALRPEAARVVEIEQVQPLRETARAAVPVPADQVRGLTAVAVETEALDPARPSAAAAEGNAQKARPRRTSASAPEPVQAPQIVLAARPAEPARVIRAIEVQPLPAPAASAPLDITAVAQRPAEERPRSGGRFGAIRAAVTFLHRSGEAVTSTAAEVKDRVWGATGGVLSSVLR
jgi:hypothetical protein